MQTSKNKLNKKSQGTARTKKPRKKISLESNRKKRLVTIAGIALVSVIGSYLIFYASAATSNFEAEAAKRSNEVAVENDTTASGGKYITFKAAAPNEGQSLQRFPGDPNPIATGKAYWGSSVGGNGDPVSRHETPTGKSLSIRRTFFGWDKASTSMVNTARADIAANRLPFVSTKTPKWADVGAGKHDAALDTMLRNLDNLGGPVWLSLHHEPEDDVERNDSHAAGGAQSWRSMQKRVRERMNALGTKNIALMATLMDWTWNPSSGRNPNDWWVDNTFDAYMVDAYQENETRTILDNVGMKNFIPWIESKGSPFGTAEWGLRTPPIEKVTYRNKVTGETKTLDHRSIWTSQAHTIFNNDQTSDGKSWVTGNYCKAIETGRLDQVPLKASTASQEASFKSRMQSVWDYGFANNKDWISHTYFDTCVNSKLGPWTLGKGQLDQFHDILRNDQRVQRIKSLASGETTAPVNYGTINADISVPESGTYKLWVRMKAADSKNNAVQAQFDTGSAIKLGDNDLSTSSWTWVDYKNGSTSNKATFTLSAGNHKVTLTGIEKGVKVDRVLITNESCVPSGTGDNCTIPVPSEPPTKEISIVTPKNNATVSGSVPVRISGTDNIHEVSFRINNQWQATDKTAPFEWTWDTTQFPNGSHRVVTRTRMIGDPGSKYTESTVNVIVDNKVAPPNPPEPPKDTEAPSSPSSLRAKLEFDWSKLRYVMRINWQPSIDNIGVTSYVIERNGETLGTSESTSFTDSNTLDSSHIYTYSVTAKDSAGNVSKPVNLSLSIKCAFIFCSENVL